MKKKRTYAPPKQDETALYVRLWGWIYYALIFLVMALGVQLLGAVPLKPELQKQLIAGVLYLLVCIYMHQTYHALNVGQLRVSEMIMSQALSNLLTVGVCYVATVLYTHRLINPLPLLAVLIMQTIVGLLWSLWANREFFMKRRPPRTAIIYCKDEELQALYSTPHFSKKYKICKTIRYAGGNVDDLLDQLEDMEALFAAGIPAAVENDLAIFCIELGIKGYFVPQLGDILMAGAKYMPAFHLPVLMVRRAGRRNEYRLVKRLLDIALSLTGLLVASPIMLVTALCIKLEDHGPVFYKQTRLTKNGREFDILKFRSMTVNAEQDGVARLAGSNDPRITKVGKFIRACRIDELPQIINILAGDMSIVGPRPERPEIAQEYEKTLPGFALRLQAKAGLTGQAQIYGRYNTEPYTKLQMDLMYINQMSLLYDLRLILATVKVLFMKESTQGIAEGQMTAMREDAEKEEITI